MIRRFGIALLLISGLFPQSIFARINRVPENFRTIQSAIDATRDGDTVVVDPGVYEENLLFDGHRIVVGSYILTIGGDVWIGETIIDGGNHLSVVRFSGEAAEQSTLRGFTLRNGLSDRGGGVSVGPNTAVTLEDLVISDNIASRHGGGLSVIGSSPTINRVVIEDNEANGGGGAFFNVADPKLTDCRIIRNRAVFGSAIYSENADFDLSRVLIAGNISEGENSIELWGGFVRDGNLLFDHLTLSGNVGGENLPAGIHINTESAENISLTITNSILWNNNGDEVILSDGDNEWDGRGSLTINYSDIDMALDSIDFPARDTIIWGEGMINENPLFYFPAGGDYRLGVRSPCIDVGDPEAVEDPDGSRTDMGALGIWRAGMLLSGVVVDSENDQPIPYASGMGYTNFGFVFLIECDSLGAWSAEFDGRFQVFTLRISAENYLPSTEHIERVEGDNSTVVTRLNHAEFIASSDTISAVLDSGDVEILPFRIRNNGNGPLGWRSEIRNSGASSLPAWTIRQQITVGNLTGDAGIQSAIFNGVNFYLAGAKGEATNRIWVVNREGELIDSLFQPGTSRTGFRDMEWDGELIWGVDEDSVYAITDRGEVRYRWRGPAHSKSNITYDPVEGILWISGTTINISAYDRDGNALGRSIDALGMRVYGLGWQSDATDSMNLIILQKPSGEPPLLTSMNQTTGDTLNLRPVGTENSNSLGLFIGQNFDRFAGCVAMLIQNIPTNQGGDRLDVIQLRTNRQWITTDPSSGSVDPGEESQIRLNIATSNAEFNWGLKGGIYTGELAFLHDGRGGEFIVPIDLEVIGSTAVKFENELLPTKSVITALYPQPFNATLTIEYALVEASEIQVVLIDLTGREVRRLAYSKLPAGNHQTVLSAENLGSGLYFLKLEGKFGVMSSKVVLLK